MDFFSGKNPDLIGPTMKSTLNDIMNRPKVNNSTISEKIVLWLSDFYNDYINDNMFSIFCIIILISCLVYRYYNKNENFREGKEPFTLNKKPKIEKTLLEEINNYNYIEDEAKHIAGDNPYDGHLYMNPLEAINDQSNKTEVVYPPDKMPVNMPNGKVFTRNLYSTPVQDEPLNVPDYDYNNVYKTDRSYYTGAYNTYGRPISSQNFDNEQDTHINQPYGWNNGFNSTTGKFVGQMTNSNLQNLIAFQTIADNKNSNMISGTKGNKFDLEFEKPYEE